MGFYDWLVVLVYAAVCAGSGGGLLALLRFPRAPELHNWAGCYFTGQLVATVFVLTTGFLSWRLLDVSLTLLVLGLLGGISWVLRRGVEPRGMLLGLGCLLLVGVAFPHLLLVMQWTPTLEWDARSIWMFHGKGLWHAGGVSIDFFGDQRYWWSNLDYPLHIPAQAALGAELLGHWDDQVARAFLMIDFCAYARILASLLAARGYDWRLVAAVAVLWLYQGFQSRVVAEPYVSGQADFHYATPLAMALLVLTQRGAPRCLPLAVLVLARAAATKNEGVLYGGGAVALGIAFCGWRWWRQSSRQPLGSVFAAHWRLLGYAFVLGCLPTLLWGCWKRMHGIGDGLRLFDRLMSPGLLWQSLADRSPTVLATMARTALALPVVWVAVAWVVIAVGSGRPLRLGWRDVVVSASLLGSLAVIFMTYVLTPHDVEYHMGTSLERVLFFPHLLLVVLVVLRIDAVFATERRPPAASGA